MKIRQILFAVFGLSFFLTACNPYQKLTFSNADFQKEKHVKEHIKDYDVIVHRNDSIYTLNEVVMDSSGISGIPSSLISTIPNYDDIVDSEDEKNDVHLFLTADSEVDFTTNQNVVVKKNDIDHVQMYAKEGKGALGLLLTLLIVIGAIFLGLILILVLAIASAGSGESGSGDSTSGGSDSGGSNSDSGCYVATMAYGDYNAPEVITLRVFRDRFLKKFGLGRAFITWYYKNSPSFVEKYRSKNWLHNTLRAGLNVFVSFLRIFFPSN